MKNKRTAEIKRETKETNIRIKLNIDGYGNYKISTTIPFLDHLLSLFAKHSLFDLQIKASGDTDVDLHHLVEDMGITLGKALYKAIGDAKGITRYGSISLPMDEALVMVAVDISGRGGLFLDVNFKKKKIGNFDVDLIEEFLLGFTNNAKITLHIKQLAGKNTHHIVEAIFKGIAVALKKSLYILDEKRGIPSTKGKI